MKLNIIEKKIIENFKKVIYAGHKLTIAINFVLLCMSV